MKAGDHTNSLLRTHKIMLISAGSLASQPCFATLRGWGRKGAVRGRKEAVRGGSEIRSFSTSRFTSPPLIGYIRFRKTYSALEIKKK